MKFENFQDARRSRSLGPVPLREAPRPPQISLEELDQKRAQAVAKAQANAAKLTGQPVPPIAEPPVRKAGAKPLHVVQPVEPTESSLSAILTKAGASGTSAGPSAEAPVEDSCTKRFVGRIKAFNQVHGFGFIESPEVMARFGCDVFLNHAVEGGICIGGKVTFLIQLSKAGKPQARDVILEGTNGGGIVGVGVGQLFRGVVKSYNAVRGFGFVSCTDLQALFGGRDVYVSKTQVLRGPLTGGETVEFRLAVDKHGQPQARDVVIVLASGGPLPPSAAAALPVPGQAEASC